MHIVILVTLFIIGLSAPFLVFVTAASLYALWKVGYPLLGIGFILDAVFGGLSTHTPYLYTLVSGAIIVIAELLKPYIRYYEQP